MVLNFVFDLLVIPLLATLLTMLKKNGIKLLTKISKKNFHKGILEKIVLLERPLIIINFRCVLRILTLQPQSKILTNLYPLMRKAVICSHKRYCKMQAFFFDEQQIVTQNENITSDIRETMDFDTTSKRLQRSNMLDNFS